ncbi:MAG: hypothetical protein JWO67_7198 [Streptosporangiaceae bacterium]|nr:hypothetical protein [Streptosporangiaceae bacterium]
MTLKTPLYMQPTGSDPTIQYSALDMRALLDGLFTAEGVISGSGLRVSQRSAGANFSVDVSAGPAVIIGDDVTNQGKYYVQSTSVANLTIPTPPVSGTRTHRVVAQVKDKLHNGVYTTYEWTIEVLADTGGGTPATPASALSLATVSVAAGQASVLDGNVTDTRATAEVYVNVSGPAWTSYTPTWTATTNPVIGNGTRAGRYWRTGRTVHFVAEVVMGSTTTYGSGTWAVGVPVPCRTGSPTQVANIRCSDISASQAYQGNGEIGASSVTLAIQGSNADLDGVGATIPFTWVTGDILRVYGTYEAAS